MARIEFEDIEQVDPHLVDAAMSGRLFASDLTYVERVYVAGRLSARGDTAAQVAGRLRVSPRTAQRLQAEARRLGVSRWAS